MRLNKGSRWITGTRAQIRLTLALLACGAGLLAVSQAQAIGVAATDHLSQGAINGRVDEGKIEAEWVELDALGLARQLGA